jgi:hypothetical protein
MWIVHTEGKATGFLRKGVENITSEAITVYQKIESLKMTSFAVLYSPLSAVKIVES